MDHRDARLLFATRTLRLFAFGGLSVVLVLYLAAVGIDAGAIGLILTVALLGDAAITLWLTTHADRLGRRRVLLIGAALMILTGLVFAATDIAWVLGAVAIVGVLSPNGNEVGPFLAVEQASLAQVVGDANRTRVFGWYQMIGSFAQATGALVGGLLATSLQGAGAAAVPSYRALLVGYTLIGLAIGGLVLLLSPRVEPATARDETIRRRLGLHRSQKVVARLSALFALDAFGGGFVMQSLIAFWLAVRFQADPAVIGGVLFVANILSGFSGLVAARLAVRFGLINTMVFSHLPSNILLMLVPFMPTLELAVALLFVRFAISQMDVPTRQSYTMAVVEPDERSAAAGVTGIARSLGAAVSPTLATPLIAVPGLAAIPFLVGGGLKVAYDLLLYREFKNVRPPEEQAHARRVG
ncbi:MAG: MFS transporter [Chloroflexota bacterium]